MSKPLLRRTRFVCVSDTHNAIPGGAFRLPKGDVLIHAGDLTNQGSFSELTKAVKWLEEADFEVKIVIAGNHDITLDTDFYAQYGLYFHNQNPQDTAKCQELLEKSPSIMWLKHQAAIVKLESPTGPKTTFKIFGSPYSPTKGVWAFGYDADQGSQLWDRIPLDTDVVVTHTPPKYHCDERIEQKAVGCESLRNALWRVRPRLAICGHVHEGRGAERIRWDLGASNIRYKELGVERWDDPGQNNKKISLIDLSSESSSPLVNDGSGISLENEDSTTKPTPICITSGSVMESPSPSRKATIEGISRVTTKLLAIPADALTSATRGQGGVHPSQRCDLEALIGRLGRKETFVVNAAIMASSWQHRSGGKKFNKPIVVHIDLPVWADE